MISSILAYLWYKLQKSMHSRVFQIYFFDLLKQFNLLLHLKSN